MNLKPVTYKIERSNWCSLRDLLWLKSFNYNIIRITVNGSIIFLFREIKNKIADELQIKIERKLDEIS